MFRLITLAGLLGLLAMPAMAGGAFPPITSQDVVTECAECHLLYRPQMLPAKSWSIMMNNLDDHFGEDASLMPETLKEITDYHIRHASDVDGHRRAKKFLVGVDLGNPPKKVTDTPRFIWKHEGIPADVFTLKEVGAKARCQNCHTTAGEGNFDDDFVDVPGYMRIFGFMVKKFWR